MKLYQEAINGQWLDSDSLSTLLMSGSYCKKIICCEEALSTSSYIKLFLIRLNIMEFYGKYKLMRSENFEEFLKEMGKFFEPPSNNNWNKTIQLVTNYISGLK